MSCSSSEDRALSSSDSWAGKKKLKSVVSVSTIKYRSVQTLLYSHDMIHGIGHAIPINIQCSLNNTSAVKVQYQLLDCCEFKFHV